MENHNSFHNTEKIPFKFKLFFGLSSLGSLTISGTYASLLTIFYQDYLGLSARWVRIASVAYAVRNAINDPVFGLLSDRIQSNLDWRVPSLT
jgi:GPH family glycoside/pentoside/hexuronide:cation symporter